jgi:hypothetical protein
VIGYIHNSYFSSLVATQAHTSFFNYNPTLQTEGLST